jgi:dihydropteroate synthase
MGPCTTRKVAPYSVGMSNRAAPQAFTAPSMEAKASTQAAASGQGPKLPPTDKILHWQAGRFRLPLERALVMGIVNVTPDSFSDGGQHFNERAALQRCEQLVREGADVLDIGGESTRPGAPMVPVAEELRRVLPVLRAAVTLGVPVSVDTCKAEIMQAALEAGVDIVNDVKALRNPGALRTCAAHPSVGLCLMHMVGEPATMQELAQYDNVTQSVVAFLAARLQLVLQAGVAAERVALDPGYGFGKTLDQNCQLLAEQAQLLALGQPVLVGLSRKSMLGALIGGKPAHERVAASVAAALAAAEAGAHVLRVHDVAATVDALKVWRRLRGQQ